MAPPTGCRPSSEIRDMMNKLKEGPRKSELRMRWDEYTVACQLSRGPLPDRSKHWQEKAQGMERKMRELLELA